MSVWGAAPPVVDRLRGAVDIWLLELGDLRGMEPAAVILDESETARSGRFRSPADRLRFVARRALARRVLGLYAAGDPAGLRFDRTCRLCGDPGHGKPALALGIAPGLDFSVSSSERVAVLAIGDSVRVGVDVEATGRCSDAGLAAIVCSEPERRLLAAQREPEARGLAFCRLWVRKEALVKLTGAGLAQPLTEVDTSPLGAWTDRPVEVGPGWVRDLELTPGYAAALATDAPEGPIRRFRIDPRWLVRPGR